MFDVNDPLRVEFLDGAKGGRWRLLEGFGYFDEEGGEDGLFIDVPAGFITDFASIPRPLWSWLPKTGPYAKAAVIHDWLYFDGQAEGEPVTRAYADGVFRRAMAELGVPFLRRTLMWLAVRTGGSRIWSHYRMFRP